MLKFVRGVLIVCATAAYVFAASLPARSIHGTYIEARTADVYTGACFANGEVGQVGKLAVFGWNVEGGSWQGVNLDGLSVVGVVRASHTLGDVYESAYPVKAVLIVDSRANLEQRLALQSFARRMGGDLLQDVVKVTYEPIELTLKDHNVHTATASLTAGAVARIETRAMSEGDHICKNEEVWYPPLTKVQHAMPAYALENEFRGDGLDVKWSSPFKRSAFVGTFVQPSE